MLRNQFFSLIVVLLAAAMLAGSVTTADAKEDYVIVVNGKGPTAQTAIADAFEKADQFTPYEIVGQAVEPLCGGWVCFLELVQILPINLP